MESGRRAINKALPICKHKIVFLGEQSVGKTSIINRFIFNTFDPHDHPTVGIDFVSKNITLEDKIVRLQIWDTAGQERFRALIPNYIRDSSAVVIVFDVCERSSFELIENWCDESKSVRGSEVIIYLVANKIDMDLRKVSNEEIFKKSEQLSVPYIEVSAKDNTNITELFLNLGMLLPLNVEIDTNREIEKPSPTKNEHTEDKSNENNLKFTIKKGQDSSQFKEKIKNCCQN